MSIFDAIPYYRRLYYFYLLAIEESGGNWNLSIYFKRDYPRSALANDFLNSRTISNPNENNTTMDEIKKCLCPDERVRKPYDAQLEAVCNALNYRLSVVQGPPGTGKTETILNILAAVQKLYNERNPENPKTVAIVSTNNYAVDCIFEKIGAEHNKKENGEEYDAIIADLFDSTAVLGNYFKRASSGSIDEKGCVQVSFLKEKPFFTSTIASLDRMFHKTERDVDLPLSDIDENYKKLSVPEITSFDYVIMDESSQTNIFEGLAAMSWAKHLVIIGDDKQLAPIINDGLLSFIKEHSQKYSIEEVFRDDVDKSFMSFICKERFVKSVLLDRHYRCTPSIIGFCNKYVYDGKLKIETKNKPKAMRVIWYDGDYCEKIEKIVLTRDKIYNYTEENKEVEYGANDAIEPPEIRPNCVRINQRQIDIFLNEELPRIKKRFESGKEVNILVTSPFMKPLENLYYNLSGFSEKSQVSKKGARYNVTLVGDTEDETGQTHPNIKIHLSTIHASQGKEYDIVYLLTTEDYPSSREPWCQQMRMLNVAVSRAKSEFCAITSSQWLPDDILSEKSGYWDNKRFELRKKLRTLYGNGPHYYQLFDYIYKICGAGAFEKSGISSILDSAPKYRDMNRVSRREAISMAAKKALEDIISSLPDKDDYHILEEYPLRYLNRQNELDPQIKAEWQKVRYDILDKHPKYYPKETYVSSADLNDYFYTVCLNYVVCKGEQVRLILELDGENHRHRGDTYFPQNNYDNLWLYDWAKDDRIKIFLCDKEEKFKLLYRLDTNGSVQRTEDGSIRTDTEIIRDFITGSEASTVIIEKKDMENFVKIDKKEVIEVLQSRVNDAYASIEQQILSDWNDKKKELAEAGENADDSQLSDYISELPVFYEIAKDQNSIRPENAVYDSPLRNANYTCRFSVSSAFEYSVIYKMILGDLYSERNIGKLSVLSLGCGNMIDALALLYASSDIKKNNDSFTNMEYLLSYKGVDKYKWDSPFVYPKPDRDNIIDVNVRGKFVEFDFTQKDIISYLDEEYIKPCKPMDCNVIFFPRVLSELTDSEREALIDRFSRMDFSSDKLYICASQSVARLKKDAEFFADICKSTNGILENDYYGLNTDVNSSIYKPSINERLIDGSYYNNYCYKFQSAFHPPAHPLPNYISQIDRNFQPNGNLANYNNIVYSTLLETCRKHNIPHEPRPIITRVSQIAFQIEKLSKKQEDD